jgi:hypothetical protein
MKQPSLVRIELSGVGIEIVGQVANLPGTPEHPQGSEYLTLGRGLFDI